MREINWFEWSPFQYDECRECIYLPLCMGGCPYFLYDDDDDTLPKCDAWKYNLEFFIKQKVLSLKLKEEFCNDSEKSKIAVAPKSYLKTIIIRKSILRVLSIVIVLIVDVSNVKINI